MPTVLRSGRFKFVYSQERGEPPHIRVESGDAITKYWLDLVTLARSRGFQAQDLTRLRVQIIERRHEFLEAWNAHFGRSA